jgi:hypothetical protein
MSAISSRSSICGFVTQTVSCLKPTSARDAFQKVSIVAAAGFSAAAYGLPGLATFSGIAFAGRVISVWRSKTKIITDQSSSQTLENKSESQKDQSALLSSANTDRAPIDLELKNIQSHIDDSLSQVHFSGQNAKDLFLGNITLLSDSTPAEISGKEKIEKEVISYFRFYGLGYDVLNQRDFVLKRLDVMANNQPFTEKFILRLSPVKEKLVLTLLKSGSAILTDSNQNFFLVFWNKNTHLRGLVNSIYRDENSFECISCMDDANLLMLPINYWKDWKWSDAYLNYKLDIHPAIQSHVASILQQNCVVYEFAGGDGELADLISKTSNAKIAQYHLFELNEDACKMAGERKIERLSVHVQDIIEPFKPEHQSKADLVIGSGALTTQVLPGRNAALKALRNAYFVLKEGGVLILAGHGYSLISSLDLESEGFTVRKVYEPSIKRYFYVAQKNISNK